MTAVPFRGNFVARAFTLRSAGKNEPDLVRTEVSGSDIFAPGTSLAGLIDLLRK